MNLFASLHAVPTMPEDDRVHQATYQYTTMHCNSVILQH
jgi:hypothetical protein